MAIEKMAYVLVEGDVTVVDGVLERVCASGIFQITPPFAAGGRGGGDGKGTSVETLVTTNSYSGLLQRAENLAGTLDISLSRASKFKPEGAEAISESAGAFIADAEAKLSVLKLEQDKVSGDKASHETALKQVEHIGGDSDFKKLFTLEYTRIRFGRLPFDSFQKLPFVNSESFEFVKYRQELNFVWCAYVSTFEKSREADEIFKSLYFERLRLPDYLSGTPHEAQKQLYELIGKDRRQLDNVEARLLKLRESIKDELRYYIRELRVLNECDELKSHIAVTYAYGKNGESDVDSGGVFYLTGFVPKRDLPKFSEVVEVEDDLGDKVVTCSEIPISGGSKNKVAVPVQLRNNALVRPFEMFVKMYGLPKYGTFDATAFVAVTYMLMYGIMFGDLGQGLVVFLLGLFLTKYKKLPLGRIMTRIGLSGAFFGCIYGSVFGREDIITPFFQKAEFMSFMNIEHTPHSVFDISTPLLLFTVSLGATLIFISMVLNIVIGIKQREIEEVWLSPSGVVGLVFYCSVLAGVALSFASINVMTTAYIVILIVLPLIILLFREKLKVVFEGYLIKEYGKRIKRDIKLQQEIKRYGGAISEGKSRFSRKRGDGGEQEKDSAAYTYSDFLNSEFFEVRYGSLSYESYLTLCKYNGITRFFFLPLDTDNSKTSCFYVAGKDKISEVDNLFAGLGFERAEPPATAEELIGDASVFKTDVVVEYEHKSFGLSLFEGFIELFECCLSYLTNTMSFLRIGGFVMSHAGLMLTVHTLAEGAGGGAFIVEIIGNIIVIIIEGFLVGIQVLRLEFYEMFGRFYRSGGVAFKPVNINLK